MQANTIMQEKNLFYISFTKAHSIISRAFGFLGVGYTRSKIYLYVLVTEASSF
ncbi:hypothetical protein BDZ91DRAFT_746825 [Kalaharituber pfeilii]|nr:hypothetical protein BDZ91DRAFT_746825 [Kalaharituber pfeilii]